MSLLGGGLIPNSGGGGIADPYAPPTGYFTLNGGLAMLASNSLAVSAANTGLIRYNSGSQTFQASLNGGAYADIAVGTTATLQTAYAAGNGGILLNSTIGQVFIQDAVVPTGGNLFSVVNGGGTKSIIIVTDGGVGINGIDGAPASASSSVLNFSAGVRTGITASTETPAINLDCSAIWTWATGAMATRRTVVIKPQTLAFVGPSTVATAASLAIQGAPVAGTNATITRTTPLWIQAGAVLIGSTVGALTFGAIDQGIVVNGTGNSAILLRYSSTPTETFWYANTSSTDFGTNTNSAINFYTNNTFRWGVSASNNGNLVAQNNATQLQTGNGTNLLPGYCFASDASTGFYFSGNSLKVASGGVNTWTWDISGRVSCSPAVATSGTGNTAFTITSAANTNQTASTEEFSINLNLSATVQFATGALSAQRAAIIQAPTYAFVGASTLADAATLAITGAPIAGTNATITRSMAVWVQAGLTRVDGDFQHKGTNLGFYSATVAAKQTVTGSKVANAALASLLTALATIGLITDSSS